MVASLASPELQAKKTLRDEKRKKLQAMMDQQRKATSEGGRLTAAVVESSSAGESSSEGASSSRPSAYVSYQHAGDNEDLEQGHVVLMDDNNDRGQLLREQAQSLIRNDDHSVVVSQPEGGLLAKFDTKEKAVGATALMVLLYFWL